MIMYKTTEEYILARVQKLENEIAFTTGQNKALELKSTKLEEAFRELVKENEDLRKEKEKFIELFKNKINSQDQKIITFAVLFNSEDKELIDLIKKYFNLEQGENK